MDNKILEIAKEEFREMFDKSMIELPRGISDSIMMIAVSINLLIQSDVDDNAYKFLMQMIERASNTLAQVVSDIREIYKRE